MHSQEQLLCVPSDIARHARRLGILLQVRPLPPALIETTYAAQSTIRLYLPPSRPQAIAVQAIPLHPNPSGAAHRSPCLPLSSFLNLSPRPNSLGRLPVSILSSSEIPRIYTQ